MLHLALMFASVVIKYAYGRPPLPPLLMKHGCYLASSEVEIFRVEGEAVILSFPTFARVLEVRNIALPTAKYIITKENRTEAVALRGEGRVQQSNKQLWFLPARASDSGEYVCAYRNETYCVIGTIKLQVYESSRADMEKLSFPITATVDEKLTFRCPSISDFNSTDAQIEWFKESGSARLQPGTRGSFSSYNGSLLIRAVKQMHAGVYTCQLNVLINNQAYKVSRAILLHVEVAPSPTVPDLPVTSTPGPTSSSSYRTVHTPKIQPPVIILPLNGTIFETLHGSALDMFCQVFTDCRMADSTEVTWLVNGQSVASSYLDGRALQGGRRVSEGCQIDLRLILLAMTEEDVMTELMCVTQNPAGRQEVVTHLQLKDSTFTWLVVAVVASSCFLTVVSVFLYVLFKPKRKKKMDYFLARQHSTF
uniref:Ig-like domain-containing protein n=1 Tax=Mola mola TaxID=94237 RepID=A0A3Q3XBS5_MOLML